MQRLLALFVGESFVDEPVWLGFAGYPEGVLLVILWKRGRLFLWSSCCHCSVPDRIYSDQIDRCINMWTAGMDSVVVD